MSVLMFLRRSDGIGLNMLYDDDDDDDDDGSQDSSTRTSRTQA